MKHEKKDRKLKSPNTYIIEYLNYHIICKHNLVQRASTFTVSNIKFWFSKLLLTKHIITICIMQDYKNPII